MICEPLEFRLGFSVESAFAFFVREDGVEPLFRFPCGLLHERPHRQAIDETAWPILTFQNHPIPQPREDDGGSFAEAGRNLDQPGLAGRLFRQAALVIVGLIAAGGGGEELFEGHHSCRLLVSPLSFSNGVGHPQGYRIPFCANE